MGVHRTNGAWGRWIANTTRVVPTTASGVTDRPGPSKRARRSQMLGMPSAPGATTRALCTLAREVRAERPNHACAHLVRVQARRSHRRHAVVRQRRDEPTRLPPARGVASANRGHELDLGDLRGGDPPVGRPIVASGVKRRREKELRCAGARPGCAAGWRGSGPAPQQAAHVVARRLTRRRRPCACRVRAPEHCAVGSLR